MAIDMDVEEIVLTLRMRLAAREKELARNGSYGDGASSPGAMFAKKTSVRTFLSTLNECTKLCADRKARVALLRRRVQATNVPENTMEEEKNAGGNGAKGSAIKCSN